MSLVGLGCVKTSVLAAHVETSRSNSISESQIILHTRASMRRWRIVFSTFRGCMSFTHGVIPGSSHTPALRISSPGIDKAHLMGPCNHGELQWSTMSECRTGRLAEADSDLHRRSNRKDRARRGGCIRPGDH